MIDDDTDSADTEIEDKPDQHMVLEDVDNASDVKRPGVGRGFVLGGFVLASLFGGAIGVVGGIAGTKMLSGPDKTATLRAELEQSLNDLKTASQNQTKKLGTTSSDQKKTNTKLGKLQSENKALLSKIGTLEQSISLMQKSIKNETTAANLKTHDDRIAVLEALSGEDAGLFKGAGSIAARLDALELRPLEANSTQLPISEDEDSSDLKTETPNAQSELPEPATKLTPETPILDTTEQSELGILINTFPREKMLAAVKAQQAVADKKPGWLKRALSKHIRVGNDDAPDPTGTIDAAETALKNGQITAALIHISKLNPPVRTSAAEWIQAAKKAAPTIEQEN